MGCNYYGVKIPTQKEKNNLINLIKEDKFEEVEKLIPVQIHLGKLSTGWQFLFNHNNWKYFTSEKSSLEDFLNDCEITDEFGEKLTTLEFFRIVEQRKHLQPHGFSINGYCFCVETDFS